MHSYIFTFALRRNTPDRFQVPQSLIGRDFQNNPWAFWFVAEEVIRLLTFPQVRTQSLGCDVSSYITDFTLVRERTIYAKMELVVSASYSRFLNSQASFPDPDFLLSLICKCLCAEGSIWVPDLDLLPAYAFTPCQWALLDFQSIACST